MKIEWDVTDDDVLRVRSFVEAQSENPVVAVRKQRNLANPKPEVSREEFWRQMVGMRLTSQQKSGPESHVARFIRRQPFPLTYATCRSEANPARFVSGVLKKTGGIRFSDKIGTELAANLQKLDAGEWKRTKTFLARLRASDKREVEAEVADYIDDTFLGFGPKQARNVLQALGGSASATNAAANSRSAVAGKRTAPRAAPWVAGNTEIASPPSRQRRAVGVGRLARQSRHWSCRPRIPGPARSSRVLRRSYRLPCNDDRPKTIFQPPMPLEETPKVDSNPSMSLSGLVLECG